MGLDGTPIEIPSRPAQSLLAYLILNAGRSFRREKLAGLLWPDSDETTARNNLRQTLWRLRKAVGDGYIMADKFSIAFDSNSDYNLDAATLEDATVETESADALIRSVSVYDGRLLPDFYDDWVTLEAERLEAVFEDQIQMLLDRLTQEARWREVREWAERWLAQGQVPEPAYRALMVAHARLGDQASMVATYQRCVQALDNELGVEPSEETQELYERLSKGEEAPRGRVAPSQPPAFLNEASEPLTSPVEVFIEREYELSQLNGFLERALAGRGQVALITGEAGQGKTSLLNEFARRAQEVQPELIVASGTCDVYTGVGDPYLPFRDVISMLTGDIESQWAAGTMTRNHALRLWHLLPHSVKALVDCGPDLINTFVPGGPLVSRATAYVTDGTNWLDRLQQMVKRQALLNGGQGPDQSRIFEEYTDVLAALAKHQPLLLILDDLHWADLSSISLLSHLGRRVPESPILIAGAYRPEDIAQGREGKQHPLEGVLSEFKRQFGDIWVNLGRDAPAKERVFIDALLDARWASNRLGEDFRQALTRHTEGHPLFTVELLQDMQERGDLEFDEQGCCIVGPTLAWDTLPTRVEGVIEKRIGRLDAGLRETLELASVEGEEFTAEVIAQVQGVNERELVQQLSGALDKQHRLVAAQGIQRLGSKRLSRYRFRHNLFQKYLYHNLDEVERSYWHEAVGNALEQLYGQQTEEVAVQLARHFEQAGLISQAMDYWQQAGDAAARVYANAEAIAAYRRAVALVRWDKASIETLTHLYTRLGRALELINEFDQALAIYEQLEQLAQRRGDPSLQLASLVARLPLYAVPTPLHDPVQGRTLGEQALALAQELNDPVSEANISWNLTNVYMYSNQLAQAIEYSERSIALARQLNLREQLASVLADFGSTLWSVAHFDRAKEFFREATSLWRELGNLPMLANSLAASCSAYMFAGDYDQAIAVSQEALQICRSIDNLWGQSQSRMRVGYVYWERGQPSRAIAEMEESIRLGEMSGFIVPQIATRADLSLVYGSLGAIERGLEIAQFALTTAETHIPFFRSYILGTLTQLHLLKGDLIEAEATIDQGNKDPDRDAWPAFYVFFRRAEGELALRLGDYERTLTMTQALLADLREFGMRSPIPGVLCLQGQALLELGQESAARTCLKEARAEAETIGSRRMLWQILFTLSQLEADPTEAIHLHQQAQEIIEYIADNVDDPELRTSFLNVPYVQVVFPSNATN